MQLKLAEYNSEGKFLGFLELGKHFGYFGSFLIVPKYSADWIAHDIKFNDGKFSEEVDFVRDGLPIRPCNDDNYRRDFEYAQKDEKDPLNRFNGRFNNRSFGNGKFVLIVGDIDDISQFDDPFEDRQIPEIGYKYSNYGWEYLGNLHENPELFEKL